MSRTRNATRGSRQGRRQLGYEYWASRLHRYGEEPGRATKVATHKKERRAANQWMTQVRAWAARHPQTNCIDDSRESIYEDVVPRSMVKE